MSPSASFCPVCEGGDTFVFLERAAVPVHQNLLLDSPEAARGMARGRLRMRCCERCGFAWNEAFDPGLLEYGPSYENTQTWSPAFRTHVDDRVSHLVEDEGVRDCTVVEVGCGKGRFIREIVSREDTGNRGYGFDPSYVGPETDLDGRLRFEKRFYDAAAADVRADVVVCRHVIEHVERPLDLLSAVRGALGNAEKARVYFETPCLQWILEGGVVWDLFYEHCSLFTAASLRTA
ncbi:MAG: methyltransferase domain-containing protein, partial [Planctomycetota bacterium]